jgi:hypothetical protein
MEIFGYTKQDKIDDTIDFPRAMQEVSLCVSLDEIDRLIEFLKYTNQEFINSIPKVNKEVHTHISLWDQNF